MPKPQVDILPRLKAGEDVNTQPTRIYDARAGKFVGEQPPHLDGTKLRGEDGKVYVVQGGVPVLQG